MPADTPANELWYWQINLPGHLPTAKVGAGWS
jgi:hypothetical protein